MITYDVNLCIGMAEQGKSVVVKCHDTGANIRAWLIISRKKTWRVETEPYIIPDESTAVLKIAKPDKTFVLVDGEITGGHIFFALPPQAFTAAGTSKAEVSLFDSNGRRLTTASFEIEVPEECVCDCKEESKTYVDIMSKQIGAAIDAETNAKASADSAEEAAERAKKAAGMVDADAIQTTINTALQKAKESGEFDGKDGAPGRDGVDGKDGTDGEPGKDGKNGRDGMDGYTPVRDIDYWTEADREKIVNDVLVSLMSMSYAKYNTIEDALAETNATANGKVATYTDRHGVYQVVLLGDISSNVTISVTRDCNLQLNGHKISFTASGAYLDVNTASAVSIDGTVVGSRIEKMNITSSADEQVVQSNVTHLTIIGGTYALENLNSQKYGRVIRAKSTDTQIDMIGCIVFASGKTAKPLIGCATCGELTDCAITTEAVGSDATGVLAFDGCTLTNCTVNVKATGQDCTVLGVKAHTNASIDIVDCDITVDGMGDFVLNGEKQFMFLHAVIGMETETVNITGGHYKSPRDAVIVQGVGRIDGGVFEGCQHGGAYLSGSDIKVKNATFRNIAYYGDCGWSDERFGACYVGGTADIVGANVTFYNCKFEADGTAAVNNALRSKGTNCTAYISDSVIKPMFDHDLSVAGGCNIYVGANVSYRRDKVEGAVDTTTYAGRSFAW